MKARWVALCESRTQTLTWPGMVNLAPLGVIFSVGGFTAVNSRLIDMLGYLLYSCVQENVSMLLLLWLHACSRYIKILTCGISALKDDVFS